MTINAKNKYYKELNEEIRSAAKSHKNITVNDCLGQRYIGDGLSGVSLTVNGTPGNGLGAYMNGAEITVNGNAQDAVGDTMNEGKVIIHGTCGDAAGYAMRGGCIFVRDDIGYRAGIHMKAYKDKFPVLVIGGKAGSFLGEYQAGGMILVLGRGCDGKLPVGYFCGTGMHGGKIYLRSDKAPSGLPEQVLVKECSDDEYKDIEKYAGEYCEYFNADKSEIMSGKFFVLLPNTKNPYKQLYCNV